MKSIKYILTISLLAVISNNNIYGCGPYSPEDPRHLHIFRSCSPELETQWHEGCRFMEYEKYENALLWQKITSKTIPVENIETVIYKTPLRDMKNLPDGLSGNKFIQWLQRPQNVEDLDYVLVAKEIEEIRDFMNDPWYYSYEGDEEHVRLEKLLEICFNYLKDEGKENASKRHAERYGLQILRLYFAKKDYQKCIGLWEAMLSSLPKNIITDMAASYAAGAYYRNGNKDKAIELYERSQDIGSLINIKAWDNIEDKSEYKDKRVQELEYLFNRFPNSPLLSVKLQEYVRDRESFVYNYADWTEHGFHNPVYVKPEWMGDSLVAIDDKPFYDELRNFAKKVINKKECNQKGMWNYSLAYLAYLDGDAPQARHYLQESQKYNNPPLLQNSINAFRILLEASAAGNRPMYLSRLQKDLKWIDEQMVADHNLRQESGWQYNNKLNWSVNYWQDIIRKIYLGEVVPRMEKSGDPVLALQLANYASNRINQLSPYYEAYHYGDEDGEDSEYYTKVITFDEYRTSWPCKNYFDYSNQFFELTNSVSAKEAEAYAERIMNPKSELDKFLNERGYTNPDYIFDIVGTLYLREMNYDKAVEWLSKVSSNYQSRTNLAKEGYFKLDPFSFQDGPKKFIKNSDDYKLRFAQEMSQLEKIINSDSEPNRKANAKIRYAIGLRNAFGRCWYLTQYGYNSDYCHEESAKEWNALLSNDRKGFSNNMYAQTAYGKIDLLMEEALNEFTDEEQAAQAQLMMMNFKSLVEKYPGSKAAAFVKGRCDNYYDYALQKL